jgi:septal ring factor EnvC (AmiA/AmiB activator)
MNSIPTLPPVSLDTLLYVGRAAFLVFSFALAAVAFVRLRRSTEQRRRDAERDAQHTSALLARVLEQIEALETRLAASEPCLAAISEQIETHFKSAAAASSRNYPVAIRLARAGAQAEEIAGACGLARHEADLVVRLHAKDRDARHVALMRA